MSHYNAIKQKFDKGEGQMTREKIELYLEQLTERELKIVLALIQGMVKNK